jgi:hypothetical protein
MTTVIFSASLIFEMKMVGIGNHLMDELQEYENMVAGPRAPEPQIESLANKWVECGMAGLINWWLMRQNIPLRELVIRVTVDSDVRSSDDTGAPGHGVLECTK